MRNLYVIAAVGALSVLAGCLFPVAVAAAPLTDQPAKETEAAEIRALYDDGRFEDALLLASKRIASLRTAIVGHKIKHCRGIASIERVIVIGQQRFAHWNILHSQYAPPACRRPQSSASVGTIGPVNSPRLIARQAFQHASANDPP